MMLNCRALTARSPVLCQCALWLATWAIACPPAATAQDPAASNASGQPAPATYRSRNFVVHTDLPPGAAARLLTRLEGKLLAIEKYWSRRSRRKIECYVAHDVTTWPASALPHPFARLVIARIGGGSTEYVDSRGHRRIRRTVVFASARPGVVEHEIVHAYCLQTFGSTGPVWYKEGMAEIMNLASDGESGVRCPADYVPFFRHSQRRTVRDVVGSGRFTSGISDSLREIAGRSQGPAGDDKLLLRAWTEQDAQTVARARQSYRHAWALCFFLCHNSNYAQRFHALGQSYVTDGDDSFSQAFAPVQREIDFEYDFFMNRFDVGYDVNLCRWDWNSGVEAPPEEAELSATIHAKRGYQASGVAVTAGRRYRCRAHGAWATRRDEAATNADGARHGRGRLVGVVMKEFKLSQPFDLGAEGAFTAPGDGQLFLRCQDAWNQLADNHGSVTVRIKLHRPQDEPPAAAERDR